MECARKKARVANNPVSVVRAAVLTYVCMSCYNVKESHFNGIIRGNLM